MKMFSKTTKSFVINLDKNVKRLDNFLESYHSSDINEISLERFNAVNGKTIDLQNLVTDEALEAIESAEKNGYRLRHYELTRGAVGCFLSHVRLYQRLIDDREKDFYIIFEDDAKVPKHVLNSLKFFIEHAPNDWDIIVFGVIREMSSNENQYFDKVKSWWGLFGYAINKKGANRFVSEFRSQGKIDKQIDSMMSMMIHENKLNVYSSKVHFIHHNLEHTETDIQLPVKLAKDINPFKYENVTL